MHLRFPSRRSPNCSSSWQRRGRHGRQWTQSWRPAAQSATGCRSVGTPFPPCPRSNSSGMLRGAAPTPAWLGAALCQLLICDSLPLLAATCFHEEERKPGGLLSGCLQAELAGAGEALEALSLEAEGLRSARAAVAQVRGRARSRKGAAGEGGGVPMQVGRAAPEGMRVYSAVMQRQYCIGAAKPFPGRHGEKHACWRALGPGFSLFLALRSRCGPHCAALTAQQLSETWLRLRPPPNHAAPCCAQCRTLCCAAPRLPAALLAGAE